MIVYFEKVKCIMIYGRVKYFLIVLMWIGIYSVYVGINEDKVRN